MNDVVRKLEMGRKSGKGERSERSRCNESMIGSQRRKKVLIELFLVYASTYSMTFSLCPSTFRPKGQICPSFLGYQEPLTACF